MIVTFYPHTKNTHNLRVVEFEFLKKFKVYMFQFFGISELFHHI
jgi:hypothetical protein